MGQRSLSHNNTPTVSKPLPDDPMAQEPVLDGDEGEESSSAESNAAATDPGPQGIESDPDEYNEESDSSTEARPTAKQRTLRQQRKQDRNRTIQPTDSEEEDEDGDTGEQSDSESSSEAEVSWQEEEEADEEVADEVTNPNLCM